MKKTLTSTLLSAALLNGFSVLAQSPKIYFEFDSVKVFANSKQKAAPWCGGVNNPQLAMGDLNNDGKKDLVIYEKDFGVKTFINTGSGSNVVYSYNSGYENIFPEITSYLKLVDYDSNGIADLITRGQDGFTISTGFYNSGKLNFKPFLQYYMGQSYHGLRYLSSQTGWTNAYSPPGDIPAVEDIDGDGDLDFLGFNMAGNRISYYRNCRVEDGLPKDSIRLCLKTECWGKTWQPTERAWVMPDIMCYDSYVSCPKLTDASNAICMLDIEGDGDIDVFDGNIFYPDVQLLINGKKNYNWARDTITAQDTQWSASGHRVHAPLFPATFWIDINQDGANDLLFTPLATGYENYKSVTYYKNNGTTKNPNFSYQSDTFLVNEMIDLGSSAFPAFYDYDKDGKPDLFIGSDGYYQPNGTFRSRVSYYRNTSATGGPSFTETTRDFLNLSALNIEGSAPAFGDLDNDGKDDMVVGLIDGTILFYTNTAASNSVQPVWVAGTTPKLQYANNTKTIDIGSYAAPFIYDIDKDGRPDLISGSQTGHLYFYKNTSTTPGQMMLDSITNKLGAVKINDGGNFFSHSVPFVGKIDSSGKPFLLIGAISGTIYKYDGLQSGNTTVPYTLTDSGYQGINAGQRAAVAITDIDGDTKYEMVIGNKLGGVKMYKQLFNEHILDRQLRDKNVIIYPNPAKDIVTVQWRATFAHEQVQVKLVSVTGRLLKSQIASGAVNSVYIKIEDLPAGVYYCHVSSGINYEVNPVVIVR